MSEKIFDASGWFAINNAVFDVIMPALSPNAFKVLCVAIRQTWGWVADPNGDPTQRKQEDRISYSQFMEKAGIGGRATVSRAIRECLEAGYLLRWKVGTTQGTGTPLYAYSLNTDYELGAGSKTELGEASGSKTELEPGSKTELEPGSKTELTKQKENKQTNGVGGHTNKTSQSITILTDFGVARTVARRLASERSLAEIEGWIAYAENADGLHNPVAFVVARLRDGEDAPEVAKSDGDDRRKYISGEYAAWIQT